MADVHIGRPESKLENLNNAEITAQILKYRWIFSFRSPVGQRKRAEINKNYIFVWSVGYSIRFIILPLVSIE
jgi:hypothetical protein